MTAYFIVRAEVSEAEREAFDRWYETEHLPDAKRTFGCRSAWRGWSVENPEVHMAFYEFGDVDTARTATSGDAIKGLGAEFDRNFPNVARSREVIEVRQRL